MLLWILQAQCYKHLPTLQQIPRPVHITVSSMSMFPSLVHIKITNTSVPLACSVESRAFAFCINIIWCTNVNALGFRRRVEPHVIPLLISTKRLGSLLWATVTLQCTVPKVLNQETDLLSQMNERFTIQSRWTRHLTTSGGKACIKFQSHMIILHIIQTSCMCWRSTTFSLVSTRTKSETIFGKFRQEYASEFLEMYQCVPLWQCKDCSYHI